MWVSYTTLVSAFCGVVLQTAHSWAPLCRAMAGFCGFRRQRAGTDSRDGSAVRTMHGQLIGFEIIWI
jgi:hypothetical protein